MPKDLPARSYDVVVIGSGAAGMAAAVTAKKLGLDVCVVEKEPLLGGTTARSGGVLWIPGNSVNAREGTKDSLDAARRYLQHETGNAFDSERVAAFLDNGPKMVDFFEAETSVKFAANAGFPDYHPDAPGALPGGRSIVAAPIQGQELGTHVKALRPPLKEITFVGMMFNASMEVQHFFRATKSLTSFVYVVHRLMAHAVELAVHGRAMRLTNGNALAARLAKSAYDLGIPILLSRPVRKLLRDGGAVLGVEVASSDGLQQIQARRGVVLACGGFPLDGERRQQLFPHAPTGTEHFSPASPGNTGDGLRLGEAAGGVVEPSLPNAAAWIPVSRVPYRDGSVGHFPHLIDRYKPGIIAVARNGRRFANEANSYHDFGRAMIEACRGDPETVAWLICDRTALQRYGMGFVKPFPVPHGQHLRSGYLKKGRTLRDLAANIGVDASALEATVARFNEGAQHGRDPEFGKGTTAYNRYLGDPENRPNPCVAALATAPFYAIRMEMGDLGTFAGLRANRHAQVLDSCGAPIPGLYAAGNDMASVMGGNYPGGGITLGPAMTFGFIAAHHLAGAADTSGTAPAAAAIIDPVS